MSTNYYRNSVNPNIGFNRLSIDNPFNNYNFEKTQNISASQPITYSSNTNKLAKSQFINDNRYTLEENKLGLRTNPKVLPMTNSFNLNSLNIINEQKYNPYYEPNNYPQRIDNVKDLLNDAYSENRVPKYSTKTSPITDFNHYSFNNLPKSTVQRANTPESVPKSSRIPQVNLNVFKNSEIVSSPIIDDINLIYTNYGNTINQSSNNKFKEINNAFSSYNKEEEEKNFRDVNPQLIQSTRFPLRTLNLNESDRNITDDKLQSDNNNIRYSVPLKIHEYNSYNIQNKKKEEINQNQFLNSLNYTKKEEIQSDNNSKEYYKDCSGGLIKSYAYYEESNKEFRNYMEDRGKAVENLNGDPNKMLFCIFDGHGGGEVSTFLQEEFANSLKKMLPFKDHFTEITKLFKNLDERTKSLNAPGAGSTATVVYIERQNGKRALYCANVGDSRCVLINNKGIMRLTRDDRADNPKEQDRILKQGGTILNGRVNGSLMVTRSFGDWNYKKSGVIVDPHILKIEINEDDLYLIIASDGVWDVIKDEECKKIIEYNSHTLEICKNIVIESLNRLSQDNISCFVLGFK